MGVFMRKLFFLLISVFVISIFVAPAYAGTGANGIAAVVNEEAISVSDVFARMKLIMISSGMPNSKDARDKMRPQIMNILVDEQIKVQEAVRLGIEVSEKDIDNGFRTIAGQNKMTADKFGELLSKDGVSVRTLRDQIKSQIAWSQVVQKRLRPQVKITEIDINVMRERLASNTGKTEYLLSEIFLPVEEKKDDNNARQLSYRLIQQLEEGHTPFQVLATQFSQSSAAAIGGDLGWVQEDNLQEEIGKKLKSMGKGNFSQPIRSISGYHIVLLRQKRIISEETIPSLDDIASKLGTDQLERLQRSYLLDLRASAFVEHRV